MIKLAVLLSGSGSTLQNLIDHIDRKTLSAAVACVVSSRHGVYGLERACNLGIPAHTVARKEFVDTHSFGAAVWDALAPYGPDLVVLAGFMSLLPIPSDYQNGAGFRREGHRRHRSLRGRALRSRADHHARGRARA